MIHEVESEKLEAKQKKTLLKNQLLPTKEKLAMTLLTAK